MVGDLFFFLELEFLPCSSLSFFALCIDISVEDRGVYVCVCVWGGGGGVKRRQCSFFHVFRAFFIYVSYLASSFPDVARSLFSNVIGPLISFVCPVYPCRFPNCPGEVSPVRRRIVCRRRLFSVFLFQVVSTVDIFLILSQLSFPQPSVLLLYFPC